MKYCNQPEPTRLPRGKLVLRNLHDSYIYIYITTTMKFMFGDSDDVKSLKKVL
jgi:hypothetical protein